MRAAVLLYPGCVFFEIALAAERLAALGDVEYLTPEGYGLKASNGARIVSSGSFEHAIESPYAVVLVPGGNPDSILLPEPAANQLLQSQHARGALIAGICAGNLVVAAAGLLKGKRGTHNYTSRYAPVETVAIATPFWEGMMCEDTALERDGKLITAMPWAYRELAGAVAAAIT